MSCAGTLIGSLDAELSFEVVDSVQARKLSDKAGKGGERMKMSNFIKVKKNRNQSV